MDDYRNQNNNNNYDYYQGDNFIMSSSDYGSGYRSTDSESSLRSIHKNKRSKKQPRTVNFTRGGIALLIIICLIVSTAAGFGGTLLANKYSDSGMPSLAGITKKSATSGYTLEDATGSNMTVQEITAAAKPSVVEIQTESVTSDPWMQQYVTQGAGSGVIISDDGYIITNNHVIDGASKITVTTADEKEYVAKLVGSASTTDIAVIKINAKDLKAATYGNSDQLAVGDLAVAIGNPLGELGGTVTAGIISALDRELSIDGKTMNLLQTDSSINPGNSGGGLFNSDGQLIGIVVAKSSGSDVEGLGFAIPVNTAAEAASQLIEKGYVSGQPYTGMSYTESSASGGMDIFMGGSSSTQVYIHSVEGNNAKKAGFKSGDMVYAVDGNVINSFDDLSSIITSHKVGDKVTYTIVRDGKTMDISFNLEERKGQ